MHNFGLLIESCVSVLLMVTIGYCFVLNRRLQRLHAGQITMKATIGELIAATEGAERAIANLKITARECDLSLGETLRSAQTVSKDITRRLENGQELLARITRIAVAASSVKEGRAAAEDDGVPKKPRTPAPQPPVVPPRAIHDLTRAANAFVAARARARTRDEAA
jgi:hypothetical protein